MVLLRIRSSEGTKRLEVPPSTSISALYLKIGDLFPGCGDFRLYRDSAKKSGLSSTGKGNISSLKLKHGDLLFLFPADGAGSRIQAEKTPNSADEAASEVNPNFIIEDGVDIALRSLDGKIPRGLNANCNHKSGNKCLHCTPLEPYDPGYLKEKEIKHLSFHSYLRKLSGGMDKGKFAPLENISCAVKKGCCTGGICSKCQPAPLTLNRQIYRHVDNVMFENPNIVDNFLAYWRHTGNQRMGFLYGKYEVYTDVPLGIKANVCAIYEPPQESTKDSIRILDDDKESQVNDVASKMGLTRLGWIFTDLIPTTDGVKYVRHGETYFLSSQECITAAYYQLKHPNKTKSSSKGIFGSKFVTVVVSGDKEKQIAMEGYQVSNQCMALVKDDILLPTKDAPELGFIRPSSKEKYVPDVLYRETDKYGNDITMKITETLRQLPVLYLFVNLSVSSPKTPIFSFPVTRGRSPFPIENRAIENHLQDFSSLTKHRKQFKDEEICLFFRDFHLLVYMALNLDVYHLYEHMDTLLEGIKTDNDDLLFSWAKVEHWQTVERLIDFSDNGYQ